MSNSGQAPRCQFYNGEMRLGISKTDRTRGRRFWKCTRSYGTLYWDGFIWDDEQIRFNQASRENEAVRGGGFHGALRLTPNSLGPCLGVGCTEEDGFTEAEADRFIEAKADGFTEAEVDRFT
ncbi:Hypothetical predicted protein [Prunus dulcis]|uniref:Zinc finger GRF-type domain-containing protein n=1 Tax=Prunus dulcis TaxID=3755 RepID=A0A5E4FKJ3_PRUDU|nr:Hypothetical predicted protein [Prunus dulcis]